MSRGLWFVAGAGAGLYAAVRGRRAAEAFTRDGLTDRLHAAGHGLRLLRDEVAQGRAEKEAELRERLAPPAAASLEAPTGGTARQALAAAMEPHPQHPHAEHPHQPPHADIEQEGTT